jgi:hypothetical protein
MGSRLVDIVGEDGSGNGSLGQSFPIPLTTIYDLLILLPPMQLEFSIGMFHTVLTELAGNNTQQGRKATSKGNATSLRNNTEFQRLLRDVEAEMNCIRIG